MERVQPADLGAGGIGRAIHDFEIAPERPEEPPPRIGAEVRVVSDAGRDQGVCQLQQKSPRAGTEEEYRLAIEPPRL